MKEKKNKFMRGAAILILFGLLSKVVGAIYRIPLTSIIKAEGMGLYQMVFPLYTLLLTISSSGLPSSISKLISENVAKNNYRQADRILKVSFVLLILFSVFCSLIVLLLGRFFASLQGNKDAYICYLGLCPAIIFVALISGFRGYFQGLEMMSPSAISGFFEQIFKLGFGLFLSSRLIKRGISYGVLGALLGISFSEIFAFLYLFLSYVFMRKKRSTFLAASQGESLPIKQTAKQILSLSILVTLGGLVMPLTMLIDSTVTINILKSIGYSVKSATTLFGIQTGSVGSIVNMPVVLSISVATAILPCVSKQRAVGDFEGVRESAEKAIFYALCLALPASVGCYSLAEPILRLLYAKSLTPSEISIAVSILEVASISIFYLALLQVTSGLLQGMGCFVVPLISLVCGGVLKIIFNVVLLRIGSINILGAEVGNNVCYLTGLVINLIYLKKKIHFKLSPKILILLFLSALIYFAKYVFKALINIHINFYVSFLVCVMMFVAVYLFFVFILFRPRKKNIS